MAAARNGKTRKRGAAPQGRPGRLPAPAASDTRSRILQTAFQLFHEQGYHATGIATILRPAGMDPAERRSTDPIERVFELLQQYTEGMHDWGCKMGRPIGNLALEVADDNLPARALIHRNFENWAIAVKQWLDDAGDRLPRRTDRAQLARFVLTVMEGGVMQARTAGDLVPFDDSVAQLRVYFEALQRVAKMETKRRKASR